MNNFTPQQSIRYYNIIRQYEKEGWEFDMCGDDVLTGNKDNLVLTIEIHTEKSDVYSERIQKFDDQIEYNDDDELETISFEYKRF